MEATKITSDQLQKFGKYLVEEEKSPATQEKYMRDVHRFVEFAGGRVVDKSVVMAYKSDLTKKYAIRSANSMLASLNSFLRFVGWCSFCVKQFYDGRLNNIDCFFYEKRRRKAVFRRVS